MKSKKGFMNHANYTPLMITCADHLDSIRDVEGKIQLKIR